MQRRISGRVLLAVTGVLWGTLIVAGTRAVLNYENAAGTPGTPPSSWPSASRLVRSSGKFTLVMLAHPNCPCTRASLVELEALMSRFQGRLAAIVLFSRPQIRESEVQASELWNRASTIPGVSVLFDEAREVELFKGYVSGQTMLFNPSGELAFSGGITKARGYQGSNDGSEAVSRIIDSGAGRARAPVFGCALQNPSARTLSEDSSWKIQ